MKKLTKRVIAIAFVAAVVMAVFAGIDSGAAADQHPKSPPAEQFECRIRGGEKP